MNITRSSPHHPLAPAAARRAVESELIAAFARESGLGSLSARRVLLGTSSVHVPGACQDESVFVAACPASRALTRDQLPSLAQDVFTLSLLGSVYPESRLVLLFAGEAARASAQAWVQRVARSNRTIELAVVELVRGESA